MSKNPTHEWQNDIFELVIFQVSLLKEVRLESDQKN